MKAESLLFAGVALFFLGTGAGYLAWSGREPAGTAALTVSFVMASLISFFCAANHRRRGPRPEDRKDGLVADRAGPFDFFPPHSAYPALTALGAALTALGVVFGLWLFLTGLGVLVAGVLGLAFQYVHRDEPPDEPDAPAAGPPREEPADLD
ncbi:cytochrome c oxidase polypeptide 4 [Streptomyces mashuensis]|uniref:cytochrome-c oxidase n=1 Tax=Streptomyces mashuensis TaxID=33904 RepID=A0A919B786_9ACTN|nr:cytochrome c oxidase subunit 4 [Streptomyces mashuensis]GHF65133.1 cytochrome c oxidase polypeptide 4 [Streptomyces mashuensis]